MPFSFVFFAAAATVFVLQAIPIIGIFLMFMLAMFWSVFLINAGMLGTVIEALAGRVSRWWLILPLAFYGGYFAVAAPEHAALRQLGARYNAANAKVTIKFDPAQHALVIEDGYKSGWFVQNYDLPVIFSRDSYYPEGYRSIRMVEDDLCRVIRAYPELGAAGIGGDSSDDDDMVFQDRFCTVRMPERPQLPLLVVNQKAEKIRIGSLPVTRKVTTVVTPSGKRAELMGGAAEPLGWIPMPVMGCILIPIEGPSWACFAEFWRQDPTPIVDGTTRSDRDNHTLARALGLRPVPIAERKGGDATVAYARMAEVQRAAE